MVGSISYRFVSEDEYGNRGHSDWVGGQWDQKYLKAPDPSDAGSRPAAFAEEFGPGTTGRHGTPVLDVLTVAYPGAPFYMAAVYDLLAAPFLVIVGTEAVRGVTANGVAVNVGGRRLAAFRGVMNPDGRELVPLGDLPEGIPAGTEVFVQLFVRDGNEWAASTGVRITTF